MNEPGYALVPPFNIYCWTLGFGRSPMDVASRFAHNEVRELSSREHRRGSVSSMRSKAADERDG